MPKAMLLFCLLILLDTSDCDTQKQSDRINSLEADVKQLKIAVAELKQKPSEHHYELRTEGSRTFRFDPATGRTCIQLTSDADWKRKETQFQSCDCHDKTDHWLKMPNDTAEREKQVETYYERFVRSACGD